MKRPRRLKTRKTESGATVVESVIMISISIFIFIVSANTLFYARYAGTAQWLATLAARVGSVEKPADTNGAPPTSTQLMLPQTGGQPYLSYYEQASSAFGCNGNPLSERHLRTVNLVLGEFQRVFQNKARTVSTWTSAATVGSAPLPGEFYLIPVNCTAGQVNQQATQWKVCAMVPQVLTGPLFSCHSANAPVHGV